MKSPVLHPQVQPAAQRAIDALKLKQQTLDGYVKQHQRAANAFGNAATVWSFVQGAMSLLIALLGAAVSVYPLKALSLPVAILGVVGAAMTAIAKNRDCSAHAAQNKAAVSYYLSGSNEVMAKLAQHAVTPISQDDAETAGTVANQYLYSGSNSQGVSYETERRNGWVYRQCCCNEVCW